MDTATHLEPGEGWGNPGTEEGARLQTILELVRREHQRMELSPERRDQIRDRVLARLDRIEARRRTVRALVATVAAALVAGVLLAVISRTRAWVRDQLATLGPTV